MSDLIERLKGQARDYSDPRWDCWNDHTSHLLTEAADTIERYRALLLEAGKRMKPFVEAQRDADEPSVQDISAAWESSMSMAVTFGDFRLLAETAGRIEGSLSGSDIARTGPQPRPEGDALPVGRSEA